MNTSEFAVVLAQELGVSINRSKYIIGVFSKLISEKIVEGDSVVIKHLGTFKSKQVAARKGFNMNTKENIIIPSLVRSKFIPSKILKDKLRKIKCK